MLQQVQVHLGGLPIILVCLSDGTVVFVPVAAFSAIVDVGQEVNAWIFPDEFFLCDNVTGSVHDYSYNTIYEYKNLPDMLRWLKQFKLELNV